MEQLTSQLLVRCLYNTGCGNSALHNVRAFQIECLKILKRTEVLERR
jgi:hypothetical protein